MGPISAEGSVRLLPNGFGRSLIISQTYEISVIVNFYYSWRRTMPYLMTTTTHRSLSTKGELVYNYSRHGPAFYCQKDSGRRHISNIDQRVWCFQEVVIHIFGIVFATPRLTQTWKFPSIFVDTEPRTDWMANNELLLKPWYHIML